MFLRVDHAQIHDITWNLKVAQSMRVSHKAIVLTPSLAMTQYVLFTSKRDFRENSHSCYWSRVVANTTYEGLIHDGEIFREKLCLENADGCTWMIVLNSPTFFAFAVSRTDFYKLVRRNFFEERSYLPLSRMRTIISRGNFRISPRNIACGIRPYNISRFRNFRSTGIVLWQQDFLSVRWLAKHITSSWRTYR